MTTIACEKCGAVYGIGDSPFCRDGHARVQPRQAFEPYFDVGLGRYVTGWGDIRQEMRRKKLDFRDHPSNGDIAARIDREREKQRKGVERADYDDPYFMIPPPSSVTVDAPAPILYDAQKRPMRRQIGFTA